MVNTSTVELLGAVTPTDEACAQKVKPLIYAAAGSTVGAVGLGLFGTYKLFKGRPAAGITGFIAGAIVLFLGTRFTSVAAMEFSACRASAPR